MRALEPEVADAVWRAVEPLLPPVDAAHPLGCHRPRVSDRLCFRGILIRLVTGASWVDIEAILDHRVSDTTLRARRDEWIAAGVFEQLRAEALAAFDRIVGLDLSEVALDGSLHKAPYGGEGTGPNPTDRGKLGWKWSVAVDRHGVPIGWTIDGANRNDVRMLEPTLDDIAAAGLLVDIDTLHLDRGYNSWGGRSAGPAVRDRCAGVRRCPALRLAPKSGLPAEREHPIVTKAVLPTPVSERRMLRCRRVGVAPDDPRSVRWPAATVAPVQGHGGG